MKYNLQVSLFGSYCTELMKCLSFLLFTFCSLYRTALCEFLGLKLTGSLKKINCLAGSSSSLPDERKQIEVARRKEDEKTE